MGFHDNLKSFPDNLEDIYHTADWNVCGLGKTLWKHFCCIFHASLNQGHHQYVMWQELYECLLSLLSLLE